LEQEEVGALADLVRLGRMGLLEDRVVLVQQQIVPVHCIFVHMVVEVEAEMDQQEMVEVVEVEVLLPEVLLRRQPEAQVEDHWELRRTKIILAVVVREAPQQQRQVQMVALEI
jgi:hypothetical protein